MSTPRDPGLIGRVAGAVTGKMVDVVPPEVILDHIDIDALIERIDINKVLDRVDVARLLDRVDINALLSDVELEDLVRRAGIPAIVAETTGQLAGSTLDTARRQLVGIDTLMVGVVDRLLRRRTPRPVCPSTLAAGR